jgi:hypothetical protein
MCDVSMPFNTEYGFLVKNQNSVRVKLEIDIDGTCVTGGGLILDANRTETIERFVDSARRFKFVRASHEAVADPTAEDNGSIVVRVTREYQVPKTVYVPVPMWNPYPNYGPGSGYYGHRSHQDGGGSGGGGRDNPILRSSSVSSGDASASMRGLLGAVNCSAAPSAPYGQVTSDCCFAAPCSAEEKGATVEGGRSRQVFGATTWAGDEPGSLVEFVFNLHCRTAQEDAQYQEFLRLQKIYG